METFLQQKVKIENFDLLHVVGLPIKQLINVLSKFHQFNITDSMQKNK